MSQISEQSLTILVSKTWVRDRGPAASSVRTKKSPGLERSSWITTAWWTSSHQNVAWQCLVQWKVVLFQGMGWLMARTMCSVKIWCVGSYDTIVWCDWCCCDDCVDHHEFREVQVHVMAWWCRDDGMMQSAQINVAGLWSDRTLGYKTRCDFGAVIESPTTQHNTHSTPTLLHSSTMSMINSFQFHTTWGDIISVARGLSPLRHHTGNSAYPAARLVVRATLP